MRDFSRWIDQYNEKLGLKYSQFGWTQGLDVELHDVQCSFNFCGKLFLGRGTDESENVAIVKATAEVLERYFLDQLSVAETSNGVAVHTVQRFAELNATFELLERDAFLCHFLTKTPFSSVELSGIQESKLFKSILKILEAHGAEVKFGQMNTDSRFKGIVCAIFGTHSASGFGMTLGTSVRATLHESVMSSLIESARSAINYLSLNKEEVTAICRRESRHFIRPEDHLLLGLDPAYAGRFKMDFFDTGLSPSFDCQLNLDTISVSSFQPVLDEGSLSINPPLYLSWASSSELMSLYFGDFLVSGRKLKRLESFLGRDISAYELNKNVHPFG